GSTSVSSHWYRPPPSKSITAATMGGDGENASRSIVKVAMVAGTSARRSGAMRSMAWHFTHTRCGGRCRVPHAWQRPPVDADFHASFRNDGGASGACGSGRRGGSRRRKPRHVIHVVYATRPFADAIWSATVVTGRPRPTAPVVRHTVTSAPSA